MDCNRIVTAALWDECSVQQRQEYRRHLKSCLACRRRVLREAPDQLLFELIEEARPEEFWLGFWDSLEKKLPPAEEQKPARWMQAARWAAVFAAVLFLAFFRQSLPESPSYEIKRGEHFVRPFDSPTEASSYPLIEEVREPAARYYIIESGKQEKIVMIFNPDMEL